MRYVIGAVTIAVVGLSGAQRPTFARAPAGMQATRASDVAISGELRQWHKVTLTLTGPAADEAA
jgi:hypothetical protein